MKNLKLQRLSKADPAQFIIEGYQFQIKDGGDDDIHI